MDLSRRTKEAIKVALAIVLAFGIAMAMDWDNPHWAAFAIASVSLGAAGASINRGMMRLMGTVFAFVVSLTLIALFPQQRWLFLLALSLFVSFCAYMIGGKRFPHFWQVAAFVTAIITLGSGFTSADSFNLAVLRTQETALGLLIYFMVSMLIWPFRSVENFLGVSAKLASAQCGVIQGYLTSLPNWRPDKEVEGQRASLNELHRLFDMQLNGALKDTDEIGEQAALWRHYQSLSLGLTQTLHRFRSTLPETREVALTKVFPNLVEFIDGLALSVESFQQIGRAHV